MIKKLHFKSLLLLAVMLLGVGSAWAVEVTDTYVFNSKTWTATLNDEDSDWVSTKDAGDFANNGVQVTKNFTGAGAKSPISYDNITKIVITYNTNKSSGAGTVDVKIGDNNKVTKQWAYSTGDGRWGSYKVEFPYDTPQSGEIHLTFNTTTNSIYVCSVAITYDDGKEDTDTREVTTMSISGSTTTASVGDNVETPTATVMAGTTVLESVEVKWSSSDVGVATIDESTGEITLLTEGETTITAEFEGDETYKGCEASFNLTVTPAAVPPTTYTTMEELQTAVEGMEEQKPVDATITFTDIQVSHVDGNSAYITDGDKGALIYTKGHGLTAGKVLNGTIDCQLQKYKGQTEITSFTTEGLTITDGTLSAAEKTPGDITAANQSLFVTLKEVVYDATNEVLTDGTNSIAYYDKFKTNVKLESGKVYNITGIVIVNFETVEVCPRTADDVEEVVSEKIEPTSVWKSNGEEVSAICILKNESLAISFDTNSTATASFESSNPEVATVDSNGAITLTGSVGVAIITASTEGNNDYLPSSATLSILVAEAEPEDAVFDFSLFQDYGSGMVPTNANVYVEEERTWTAGNITMKTGGKVRWYIGTSGGNTTYTLRLYGKTEPYSYMTISAPDGYVITAISGLGGALKASTGENKSGNWSGMAQEITFTYENTNNSSNMSCIKVTYTKPEFTMNMNGSFTTFCANMSIDFSTSGIKAYTAKANNGIVKLTEVDGGKIPAGKGVILKGDAGSHDVKVIESAEALSSTNELIGVIEETEIPWSVKVSETTTKYNYILQSGEFKKATGAKLKAGKAYLSTKYDVTGGGESRLTIVIDGETTGIKATEQTGDGAVYSLSGQRVVNPAKGLYIVNGKKYVIK